MTALLEVSDVTVRFGGLMALDGLSFTLAEGGLVGLIGPNGAGKTTALKAITGSIKPERGTVRLAGRDITGLPVHARARLGLALSHQIVRPFRNLSVLDNVALAAGLARTADPWRALTMTARGSERARAREILALLGIEAYAESEPGGLPLGVLKRLEVARALALNARLLLLDEPLAGLNSIEAAALADLLATLNHDGVSLLLIEHNLGEVLRICSRLLVLDNGGKIADGPAAIVMNDQRVRTAYLGTDGDREAERTIHA